MTTSTRILPNMIKDITMYYIEFYYNKYLADNKLNKISDSDLRNLVNEIYGEKKKDLCNYIRTSLKDNLKDDYNNLLVEEILLEMFDDPEYAKERVIIEILNYQKSKN